MGGTIRLVSFAALWLLALLAAQRHVAASSHDLDASHYTAGSVDVAGAVVLLVDAIGPVEKGWADSAAASLGGAALLVPSEIFSSDGNHSEELSAALQPLGFSSAHPPVIGFGAGANRAVQLSYHDWPVSVAVTPDLTVMLPDRNVTMTEADEGAILLIVSDIEVNGPYVTGVEEKLVLAGIHWETIRYGNTTPAFYHADDPEYKAEIWTRAWGVILSFLSSATSEAPFAGTENPGSTLPDGVLSEMHEYSDGEASLQGYLAYPASASDGANLPAVVVLPDWDHTNQYEISRANMLANMGYVTIAADIFGMPMNTTVADRDERVTNIMYWLGNPDLYVQRIHAAVDAVKQLPMTNADAIALAGYCFGGSGVVFDVLSDSSLKVDVSFHGGLGFKPPVTTTAPMMPYLSYQSGGNDESPEDIDWLQTTLMDVGGAWDITRYSQVEHGFSKWGPADSAYHERADGRSWNAMMELLAEFLPVPVSVELSEYFVAGSNYGSDPAVVLLVDSITDVEKSWAESAAQTLAGGALVLVASEVFPTEMKMADHLKAAIASTEEFEGSNRPPVVGFGGAATHALLLAYHDWPVAVAVVPDLSLPLPAKTKDMSETDDGPILLLISDVETNGAYVTGVEEELKAAGIHWETVRYGLTDHMFFHSASDSYMPEVWDRAWNVALTFLLSAVSDEGFTGTENPGQALPEGVSSEMPFPYSDGVAELEGYLAYPSGAPTSGMEYSAVVVLPDWDHVNEYEIARANMLAEMGYVALVADVYALPVNTSMPDMAMRRSNATFWRSNPDLYVQRLRAAVTSLKDLEYVNADSLGLIGYCFGGTGVVFDVFSDSSLQVDVSFHGGISQHPEQKTITMTPYLSYQSGGNDESPEDIKWLQDGLMDMGGNWDITRYSQVEHGFTVWGPPGSRYHERAEGRSWEAMKELFSELLMEPKSTAKTEETDSGATPSVFIASVSTLLMTFMACLLAVM